MMHYGTNVTGNNRFYGFCVDILDRIAQEVGFDYIIDLVPDRKYGAKDPITGEWNGMVAQLIKHVRFAVLNVIICTSIPLNAYLCRYLLSFPNLNNYLP